MRDFRISGDTIVAISTALGRGGIGVVRLSGDLALGVATAMFRSTRPLEPGRAVFGELLDPQGSRLDEAVVTYFRAPHSYTREDVVEIAAHGSPVLLQQIVRQASAAGARVAEPGEFTRRALLNGRINLTQAEAVRDLIEAHRGASDGHAAATDDAMLLEERGHLVVTFPGCQENFKITTPFDLRVVELLLARPTSA